MNALPGLLSLCLVLWGAMLTGPSASSALAGSPIKAAPVCADFLAQMHKKPADLQFVRCSAEPERQGKPLRAVYRVSGNHAARTEAYLIKTFGLTALKRSCCQWDGPAQHFKSASGHDYSISMVSVETDVATRAQWQKIPRFEIIVEMLTEEI